MDIDSPKKSAASQAFLVAGGKKKPCCCSMQCCCIALFILLVILTALYFIIGGARGAAELATLSHANVWLGSPKPWRILYEQTKEQDGGGIRPSIRYGHAVTGYRGKMITTHGYFYNAAQNLATWLSDTWAMDMISSQWSLLSPGISQAEAMRGYRKQGHPPQPCGRFGHGIGVFNHTLYMYGGHDGGYSKTGQQNYDPGHDFDELWAFNILSRTWSLVHAKPDPSSIPLPASHTEAGTSSSSSSSSPGNRYLLASTIVDGKMIVYGGSKEGQGDVWSLDLTKGDLAWHQLAPELPREQGGPGRRVGAALMPVTFAPKSPGGVLLYAGRNAGGHADEPALLEDAWFFDLSSNKWRPLVSHGPAPSARRYHGHTHTYIPVPDTGTSTWGGWRHKEQEAVFAGLVVGGSVASPSHVCAGDAWAFTLDCNVQSLHWVRLPNLPYAIYDTQAAAHKSQVFVFGGHLCRDSKKNLPFSYSNQVWKLDLAPHVLPQVTRDKACHVKGDPGEVSINEEFDIRDVEL